MWGARVPRFVTWINWIFVCGSFLWALIGTAVLF